jgi:hypothetical protein
MYNLAGVDAHGPLATLPVPASLLGLTCLDQLNSAYANFVKGVQQAQRAGNVGVSYFRGDGASAADFDTSITSFLCTDDAFKIFDATGASFLKADVEAEDPALGDGPMTTAQIRQHALKFYQYADIEGFRGTPHKL